MENPPNLLISRPLSGIPRQAVSRLPLPTSSATRSVKPSPSRERLQADPGLNSARLRRPSEDAVFKQPRPKVASSNKSTEPSTGVRSSSTTHAASRDDLGGERIERLDGSSSAADCEDRGRIRQTRPSLSERTIETLSRLPDSPASVRRQSSFFATTSPQRLPSRPSSPLNNYSRSPSRSSPHRCNRLDLDVALQSRIRLPSMSRISPAPKLPQTTGSPCRATSSSVENPSKPARQTARKSGVDPVQSFSGGKSTSKNSEIGYPAPKLLPKKTRKPASSNQSTMKSPSSAVWKRSSMASVSSEFPPAEQHAENNPRKPSRSSNALRESIAKAKAAQKAATRNGSLGADGKFWESIDVHNEFNQRHKDSKTGLLRKRVEAARISGHLNIAAMSLKELPGEVLSMYEFDPNSSTDWYESVDLVKFIAADNELESLPDTAFPDVDPYDEDVDADGKGNQFGGLEVLDVHGNVLGCLPLGLGRLQRLQTLNLSSNQLSMADINVVWGIESLTELRLACNNLEGPLPADLSRLSKLEVLDLHDNSLTELPKALANLSSLKVLNAGENELTSLPLEGLNIPQLRELSLHKNKLTGTLFPQSIRSFNGLRILNVASNNLSRLSDSEDLEMPHLQTLVLDMNRIQSLPNVSSWQALLTLSAEGNKISEIPPGFCKLKNLKNVDLTGNDIRKLDEKIGLMENLFSFRIGNNPLRERKLLSMNTEDLKRDLRSRCDPQLLDSDDEGSVATQFTLAPEAPLSPSWRIKPGGVLDRSHTDLTKFEPDMLEAVSSQGVRCLYLHHNRLRSVPVPTLNLLAHTLTDLDLSHNTLDSLSLFSSSFTLPNLQNLNLSGTTLTTIEHLQRYLSAPSLTCLDVSTNRLAGSLPVVRGQYPKLTTLLAADNRLTTLDFEAVQGLQVLDVSNNNISFLPPKLGLLGIDGPSALRAGGLALRRFEIAGNSFRVPRWQVVAKGTDAVLSWLRGRIPAHELARWEVEGV